MGYEEILKSLWGRVLGLNANDDLVHKGRIMTLSGNPVGAPNGTGVVATEYGNGVFNRTVLTLTNVLITVADDAGVAQYGGAGKIYDFPEGLLNVYGAIVSGTLTMGETGTFINTWSGVVGLGTAAASTGATLVSTEADIMQSNAIAAAVAKVATIDAVSAATALTEAAMRTFDGTATAKDMYLNIAIADDATHTAGTGRFTGTVKFDWSILGDN